MLWISSIIWIFFHTKSRYLLKAASTVVDAAARCGRDEIDAYITQSFPPLRDMHRFINIDILHYHFSVAFTERPRTIKFRPAVLLFRCHAWSPGADSRRQRRQCLSDTGGRGSEGGEVVGRRDNIKWILWIPVLWILWALPNGPWQTDRQTFL